MTIWILNTNDGPALRAFRELAPGLNAFYMYAESRGATDIDDDFQYNHSQYNGLNDYEICFDGEFVCSLNEVEVE